MKQNPWKRKRLFSSFLFAFVVLSLLSSLLYSPIALAISDYDQALRKQEPPVLLSNGTCGDTDVTDYIATAMADTARLNTAKAGFGDAYASLVGGEEVGVVGLSYNWGYYDGNRNGDPTVVAFLKIGDPTANPLQWGLTGATQWQSYVNTFTGFTSVIFYLNATCDGVNVYDNGSGSFNISSNDPGDPYSSLFQYDWKYIDLLPFCAPSLLCIGEDANEFYNYPADYEGGTFNPPSTEDYKIDAMWTLSAEGELYVTGLPDTDTCLPVINPINDDHFCEPPIVRWPVYTYTLFDSLGNQIDQQTPGASTSQFKYSLRGYGNYEVLVELTGLNQPVPFLPLQIDPDGNIIQVRLKLTHNGLNYIGNTFTDGDAVCSVVDGVNECEVELPYRDCSSYFVWNGTEFPDLGGGLACLWDNTFIGIKSWFTSMWVPDQAKLTRWQESMQSRLNEQLGFVYQSIATILGMFALLYDNASTGDCYVAIDANVFTVPMGNLDLCEATSLFGEYWDEIQVFAIGVTVLILIWAGYAKYHQVLDQR